MARNATNKLLQKLKDRKVMNFTLSTVILKMNFNITLLTFQGRLFIAIVTILE